MHILACHLLEAVQRHGNIVDFWQQGVEKLNDMIINSIFIQQIMTPLYSMMKTYDLNDSLSQESQEYDNILDETKSASTSKRKATPRLLLKSPPIKKKNVNKKCFQDVLMMATQGLHSEARDEQEESEPAEEDEATSFGKTMAMEYRKIKSD